MFKRLFWLTVGLAIGFGTSFWVYRLMRVTLERYQPERVAKRAAESARGLREDLRAAFAEGREAMRQAEADLRTDLRRR